MSPLTQQYVNSSQEDFLPQLIVGSAQSVGRQRDHNEDSLFTLATTFASHQGNIPFGLFIIADGMGGHQHGEIASEIATMTMVEYVSKNIFSSLFKVNAQPFEGSLQEILANGVQESHEKILQYASGGGTTLTTVIILGHQMAIAHVGDSRAYSISQDGTIKALTRDHSFVSRLVELEQITPAEAAVHPRRNVLYRAMGQESPVDPEIIVTSAPKNCSLMICSDGLWGEITEKEISAITLIAQTPQQACQLMVDAANAAGGPDNISAIMVKLP
ncbi:MAG: serine/threonine-protein phosphatase [Chloroflexi bacterium]|nr:serine/threonine-protein phosphatase [Chloroflexota bacterium]